MGIIEAKELIKRYGKVLALNGLSLDIPGNSIFGLIGPNGAGKTTTLKIILGLLRPDSGKIWVFGEDPWDNVKIRNEIGFLHEKPSYPREVSCIKYLTHIAKIYGLSMPERKAFEYLKLVGLGDVKERKIKGLSAGMLQRLGLAQALISEPKLIILDEPTSNLDPHGRVEILSLIYTLFKDKKIDFLISSHVLPELSRVCEDVAFIHKGKVYIQGNLDELFKRTGLMIYRIMVDEPGKLVQELSKMNYIESLSIEGKDIIIRVKYDYGGSIYHEISQLAQELGLKLHGIESRSAGLEELFRRVVEGG